VNTYGNGVVSENFDPVKLAQKLNPLRQEDVMRFKKQSAVAALHLNAEKNEILFDDVVSKVTGK